MKRSEGCCPREMTTLDRAPGIQSGCQLCGPGPVSAGATGSPRAGLQVCLSRPPPGRGLHWMEAMEAGRTQPPARRPQARVGPGGERTAVQAESSHAPGKGRLSATGGY